MLCTAVVSTTCRSLRRPLGYLALLALAACETPAAVVAEPDPRWTYPPPPSAWPPAVPRTGAPLGRTEAPLLVASSGLTGTPREPLRDVVIWSVPGDGPARAVIAGRTSPRATTETIDVIDVDRGHVLMRDSSCRDRVVGVTARSVVCAGPGGAHAIPIDGGARWQTEATFVMQSEAGIVVVRGAEMAVLDPDTGDERARVVPAGGLATELVRAVCGTSGTERYGVRGGDVIRADAGVAKPTWTVKLGPLSRVRTLDACSGEHVLVDVDLGSRRSLVSIDRATGIVAGRVEDVLAWWRSPRLDHLHVSLRDGVVEAPRDLGVTTPTGLPRLGPLLAEHRDTRLVVATPGSAVLLGPDRTVRFAVAAESAALGDRYLVAATATPAPGRNVRRFVLPAATQDPLGLTHASEGVSVPAELRDLPEPLPPGPAVSIDDSDDAVLQVAMASDGRTAYVLLAGGGVVAIDVERRSRRWQGGACGGRREDGEARGAIAIAGSVVACAVSSGTGATITAVRREDGARMWSRDIERVERLDGAGALVVASSSDRAIVLDATTGETIRHLASDDGGPPRVAVVEVGGETVIVSVERGSVVARLARRAMTALWVRAVDGVVRALSPSRDGVLVVLDDRDAYRLDAATGAVTMLPAIGVTWTPVDDVLAATTAGGPIPGEAPSPAVATAGRRIRALRRVVRRVLAPLDDPERPKLWTPIPAPPPAGASTQVTLHALDGGVRARNDYALIDATIAPHRYADTSPLVLVEPGAADGQRALVLDPRRGDPLRRVVLPGETRAVLSTTIDGTPVVAGILERPLRLLVF